MPYLCTSNSESVRLTISWINSARKYVISSIIHIKQHSVQKTEPKNQKTKTVVNLVKPNRKPQFFAKPNQKLNRSHFCELHTPFVALTRHSSDVWCRDHQRLTQKMEGMMQAVLPAMRDQHRTGTSREHHRVPTVHAVALKSVHQNLPKTASLRSVLTRSLNVDDDVYMLYSFSVILVPVFHHSQYWIVSWLIGLILIQGCHKPGKPGILRYFSEHGKLREFYATSAKNCNKQSIFSSSFKYLCKTAVDWVNRVIRGYDPAQ